MKPEYIFLTLWFITVISIITTFIIKGKKSLNRFPKIDKSEFQFIENAVSGYSNSSFKTKAGGAQRILKIRVTRNEFWITTNTFMAWLAEQFDLLHKIPIKSITSVVKEGNKINLEFIKNGETKRIVLISKKRNELIRILTDKMNK